MKFAVFYKLSDCVVPTSDQSLAKGTHAKSVGSEKDSMLRGKRIAPPCKRRERGVKQREHRVSSKSVFGGRDLGNKVTCSAQAVKVQRCSCIP